MPSRSLTAFWRQLRAPAGADVFNPWIDVDDRTDLHADAPQARRQRLAAHLDTDVRLILVGEAPGYQGCHVTGIAFTSERLILAGSIPRVPGDGTRLSTRHIPWSEPSATTVWGTLYELGIAERTVLWNAYPWHPHKPDNRQSNRTPTPAERIGGVPVLQTLLDAFPRARVLAVGRTAEASMRDAGRPAQALRHPSMGGSTAFRSQLRAALKTVGS
jgi:uracil-DNA glycosylase